MRRFLLAALFSFLFLNGHSQAQYISFRIDSAIRAAMEQRQIPGMQVAVVKYGLALKKANYGFANLDYRVAVTDSTMFSIASMSKAFTCAGILLLMEDGKLTLDDPISKYFDSLPESWNGITIRRLMNHTAGLRDDWDEGDDFFFTHKTDSALFDALKKAPLKFQPGEGWSYGCGPFVLGMIIAKVSGMSYPEFMQQRIFDRLGMKNTRIDNPELIITNRATGYRLKDGRLIHGRQISAAAQARGDVGVLTTVNDMLKWFAALKDSSLLQKSSLQQMFSPGLLNDSSKTGYGFGWFLEPYRDHALVSHDGAFRTGFNSVMEFYPEDHVCIIILSNLHNAGVHQIAKDIVGLFNTDYKPASEMDSVADPDSVRTLLLKSFYEELGLNVDSTRKIFRDLHVTLFYPESDADLSAFRYITKFEFVRSFRMSKPEPDIFGDLIQGIYIYKIKSRDFPPTLYVVFYLDPSGKVVHINLDD
jgi:CubicO group peptidase (beta-lactamase class C family)